MTAAFRLFEEPDARPTFRPSMRPTLVPSLLPPTLIPRPLSVLSAPRITEGPTTQRSATVHPRAETAARAEAQHLLAVMRMNAEFLSALLAVNASAVAIEALQELQRGIERLEHRFATFPLR